MKKLHLLKTMLLLCALIVGSVSSVWATPTVLFHESFGDNTSSARDWSDSYSVKSGVTAVYSGITGYTVSNVKQGKNTTGSTKSGLNQSTSGTDASIIIGPLNVSSYNTLTLTYQWKAGSIKGTYSTHLYYATSSGGSYTEVSGTGTGATSFVERSYNLPAAAQVSTLYLKIVWNTSNTQAIIDEVELTGIESTTLSVTYDANGATSGSVPTDNTEYEAGNEVTVLGNTGSLAKAGYNFGGWNTNATGTGTNYNPGETFEISESTTLYAKWNAKTITGLSYTGTPTKTTYNAGESFNPTGLTVTATFDDSSEENVTASVTWAPDPLTKGTTSVTGTYMGEEIVVNGLTVNAAPGTKENPYTVAQARAAIDAGTGVTGVYVTGIVCEGGSSLSSGAMNYWISDDGTENDKFEIYKGKGIDGKNFSSTGDVQVGDIVVVTGNLTKYSSTYEFSSGSQLVSLVRKAATPTFSPAAGAVAEGTEVTISTLTDGATIYYTTDGTEPTTSSSHGTAGTASATVTVNATMTIKAIAVKDGLPNSDVATASYTIAIPCATPTFSPAAGTYTAVQSVEISSDTEGATIYYTTDGTTPTTLSTEYTSAITVDEDMTIKAIAVKDGMTKSAVAEAIYEINLPDYATLPFEYDGNGTGTLPTGLTVSGTGTYTSSPKIKLDTTDDNVILKIGEAPGMLSFDVKGNPSSGSWTGTFKVQTSTDGSSYSDLAVYTDNISTSKETKTLTVPSDARYIKWILTDRKANVALGNIKLSGCQTVTITSAEYATYCNSTYDLDFSETGITVYTAEDNGETVRLNEIAGGQVPANTPVVLYKEGADGSAIAVPVIAEAAAVVVSNDLEVSDGESATGEDIYVLSNKSKGVGFYPWVSASSLSAGKVFLRVAGGSTAREFIGFDGGETTAISEVRGLKSDVRGEYFNLNGQRVAQPTKGLYIVNGKKVMFK